jgi:hypothetical protein
MMWVSANIVQLLEGMGIGISKRIYENVNYKQRGFGLRDNGRYLS